MTQIRIQERVKGKTALELLRFSERESSSPFPSFTLKNLGTLYLHNLAKLKD